MVVAGEVGFLLREKLTEFKCGLGFSKLFSGDFDLAKPRLIFSGGIRIWFPARRRGLGRNPRGLLNFEISEQGRIKIYIKRKRVSTAETARPQANCDDATTLKTLTALDESTSIAVPSRP